MKLLCPEAQVVPEAGVDADGCRVSPGFALVQGVQHASHEGTGAWQNLCCEGELADQ
jgi:hypothetical protein